MSGVRGLLVLVSGAAFLEALFFTALAPMLPGFKDELGLTTSQAGVLVAMFHVGIMVAVIPMALCTARLGVKPTLVGGLAVFAATSVAFAFAPSLETLLVARLLQGVGSAALWNGALVWLVEAGPADRRGAMIGVVVSAMAAGQVAGPVLGGVSEAVGREPAFVGAAVVAALLCAVALRYPAPAEDHGRPLGLGAALGPGPVRNAMLMPLVPAMLAGTLAALAPLKLDGLGVGSGEIATTFGVAAAICVLVAPFVGRWSDRRGRMRPIRAGVLAGVAILVPVAVVEQRWVAAALVVAALVTVGAFWTPVTALLSDACDEAGVGQVVAVAIVQLALTPGSILGAAGGGAIAEAVGLAWAFLAVAVALVLVYGVVSRVRGEDRPYGQLPPLSPQGEVGGQ